MRTVTGVPTRNQIAGQPARGHTEKEQREETETRNREKEQREGTERRNREKEPTTMKTISDRDSSRGEDKDQLRNSTKA